MSEKTQTPVPIPAVLHDQLVEILKQHELIANLEDEANDFTKYFEESEKFDEMMDKLRVDLGMEPLYPDLDTGYERVAE